MSGIREVRHRIKSIINIRQITRAMKMVAAARLHKAQSQLMAGRPYAGKLYEMIQSIAAHSRGKSHPLLRRNQVSLSGLVVMTSDKGLCAGFNAPPLQVAGRHLADQESRNRVEIISLGRKGLDFFRRTGVKPYREWVGFWQDLNWHHADMIGQELIEAYIAGRWSRLHIVYNRFKSVIAQEVVEDVLLPLPEPQPQAGNRDSYSEFEFEPSAEQVYAHLLPRYIKITIWHALLESKAAELATRMQAMDNAAQSAGEMIEGLTLQMNRARQAAITREIAELVGSAEAINA